MTFQIILLLAMLAASVVAILAKDLLKSAVALAVSSLFLGIIFFRMGAPYAGVFEISVVAGLITVLFMLTIALTRQGGDVRESKTVKLIFPLFFVAFILIDVLVMRGVLSGIPSLEGAAETGSFGDVLWKERSFDLIGQLAVILAGVFSVLALFRKRDHHD